MLIWDEPKRLANLSKRRFDFEDAAFFEWERALVVDSYSGRLKAIGKFRGRTVVVVYTRLGDEALSIVSFRPANRKERKLYDQG